MLRVLAIVVVAMGGHSAVAQEHIPPRAQIAAEAGRVTDPRDIVVLGEDPAAVARLVDAAAPLGYVPIAEIPAASIGVFVQVLTIPDGRDGPAAIQELEALEPEIIAGVNHAYDARNRAARVEGRSYANALLRWPEGGCPAQRPVGVIDAAPASGAPVPSQHRRFARGGAVDDDHGWMVTDLILDPARLHDPSVFVADVVGRSRSGREEASVDAIVAGLAWLKSEGVDLVNISLAGPYNKILDRSFARAAEHGMLMVAAAGNEGPSGPPRFPAAFPDVVSVTAVDAEGALYARALRGPEVDIAAPGVDIFLNGKYVSGTSFSTAFVTAFLASQTASMLSADDAREALQAHQRPINAGAASDTGANAVLDLKNSC